MTVRMEDASKWKQRMFHHYLKVAQRSGEKIMNGQPVGAAERARYAVGNVLVYGPLRNRLGMTRMRVGYTAGEAIGPEIFRFYRGLGLNLKQLYGQTEACVYITGQPDGEIDAETVGTPMPEVELRHRRERRGPLPLARHVRGLLQERRGDGRDQDRRGLGPYGRCRLSSTSGGQLRIIDRAKDVGKLTDGSMFPPKYIENKLKFFPNIKEAVAIGDGRDFATVMLNIDMTAVSNWAERNDIAYASYQELAQHPAGHRHDGRPCRRRESATWPARNASLAPRFTASSCCTRSSTPMTGS